MFMKAQKFIFRLTKVNEGLKGEKESRRLNMVQRGYKMLQVSTYISERNKKVKKGLIGSLNGLKLSSLCDWVVY